MTKQMILLGLLCLAAGCGYVAGDPGEWRQKCRHTYTMDVDGRPQEVHRALATAMHSYGWGSDDVVVDQFYEDTNTGSVWVYEDDPRDTVGFMLDVGRGTDNRVRITVYPVSDWYARKSREWLTKTLNLPTKEGT